MMNRRIGVTRLVSGVLVGVASAAATAAEDASPTLATAEQWRGATAEARGTAVQSTHGVGGRFDLLGRGALLLSKRESPFWRSGRFVKKGEWVSTWHAAEESGSPRAVRTTMWVYGQRQSMEDGWEKFSGNPLACRRGWKHATAASLELPKPTSNPNDQSLARGTGRWTGKWLLLFNIGGWARKGWGAAVADSLAPLKEGENPFEVMKPYPLVTAEERGGKHAPNDFIYVEATERWYTPDETGGAPSHMWTSRNGVDWTNRGTIQGLRGHDPGMCYDGRRFHLFTETGETITHCRADDPLGKWKATGSVVDAGGHTGDADVSFFNNRWHMFFDDAPHRHYQLGYAWTTPSEFPRGWRITHHIYGPHNPEQKQKWDNDTKAGNRFGTGDADVAVEGRTLYLTHERPIGAAHKTLDVLDASEQKAVVRVEADKDGDDTPEKSTGWLSLATGRATTKLPSAFRQLDAEQYRIRVRLRTRDRVESPMLRDLTFIRQQ